MKFEFQNLMFNKKEKDFHRDCKNILEENMSCKNS